MLHFHVFIVYLLLILNGLRSGRFFIFKTKLIEFSRQYTHRDTECTCNSLQI